MLHLPIIRKLASIASAPVTLILTTKKKKNIDSDSVISCCKVPRITSQHKLFIEINQQSQHSSSHTLDSTHYNLQLHQKEEKSSKGWGTHVAVVMLYRRMESSSLEVTRRSSLRWKSRQFIFPACSRFGRRISARRKQTRNRWVGASSTGTHIVGEDSADGHAADDLVVQLRQRRRHLVPGCC